MPCPQARDPSKSQDFRAVEAATPPLDAAFESEELVFLVFSTPRFAKTNHLDT
jgi:hypothetical protein